MLILISKEDLESFLEQEIKAWECVGGGPNLDAFSFSPKEVDPNKLRELGYYDNRDAWIAGARIKDIRKYLEELSLSRPFTGK